MEPISPPPTFQTLPDELKIRIFGYLSPSELSIAMRVHSTWKTVADDPSHWKRFARLFAEDHSCRLNLQEIDGKMNYKNLVISFKVDQIIELSKNYLSVEKNAYSGSNPIFYRFLLAREEYMKLIQSHEERLNHLLGNPFLSSLDHLQYFMDSAAFPPSNDRMELRVKAFRSLPPKIQLVEELDPSKPLQLVQTRWGQGLAGILTDESHNQALITFFPNEVVVTTFPKMNGRRTDHYKNQYTKKLIPNMIRMIHRALKGEPIYVLGLRPYYLI